MKIDTEGHEHEVLKSAKLLLSRDIIKYLVVEIVIGFYLLDYKRKTSSGSLQSQVRGIELFSDLFFVATSERDSSWTCKMNNY